MAVASFGGPSSRPHDRLPASAAGARGRPVRGLVGAGDPAGNKTCSTHGRAAQRVAVEVVTLREFFAKAADRGWIEYTLILLLITLIVIGVLTVIGMHLPAVFSHTI